jgi:hypothetical protein
VDFYDFTGGSPPFPDDEDLGDLHERAVRNGARHGTPVIVGAAGRVDSRINLFFRTGAMADRAPSTWRRYAYALVVWLEFLAVFGREWHEATAPDVEAFKHWRLTDLSNDDRVAPTSFDTDLAALNSFYRWASARYGVLNPVPTIPARSGQRPHGSDVGLERARGTRDPIRPSGSTRHQVKWMLRSAFEQWRDIGLRGYGFDGLRQPGWRAGLRTGTRRSLMVCTGRACGCGSGRVSWMWSCRRSAVSGFRRRGCRRRVSRAAGRAATTGSRARCWRRSPPTPTRWRGRGPRRSAGPSRRADTRSCPSGS